MQSARREICAGCDKGVLMAMFGRGVRRFRDRTEVGRLLAIRLLALRHDDPVVLALPRGGVPVGLEIALRLDAPLDLVLVRKIGMPGHKEYALGAVVDGDVPLRCVNPSVAGVAAVSAQRLDRIVEDCLQEIERRRKLYLRDRRPVAVEGRTAIIVDDGVATGATVRAALRSLSRRRPARRIVAIGVAPPSTVRELRAEADDVICLHEPPAFRAVGAYFDDFSQVDDDAVIEALGTLDRHPRQPV